MSGPDGSHQAQVEYPQTLQLRAHLQCCVSNDELLQLR